MRWEYGHSWMQTLPLMLLGVAFWSVLFMLLAWALIRWLGARRRFGEWYTPNIAPEQLSSIEILRQRYARGEIDALTFEQMRERLEASDQQSYQYQPYEEMQEQRQTDGRDWRIDYQE